PHIVDRVVPVAGGTARVIGVTPPSFRPRPGGSEEYWKPFGLDWADRTRSGRYAMVIGRLKPGVTMARAQADMTAVALELEREAPTPWIRRHSWPWACCSWAWHCWPAGCPRAGRRDCTRWSPFEANERE